MVLIRRFEEQTGEMYTRAKIGGYCHLNLGEEATIVGVMSALNDDYIFTNYREHGYILRAACRPDRSWPNCSAKRPASPAAAAAPCTCLMSRRTSWAATPSSAGRCRWRQVRLAIKSEKPGVVVCQMGDATTNIGAWHESLNLAQLWKLPVIFLIVNNQFGMGTSGQGLAEPELYKKGCLQHERRARGWQRRAGRP